MNAKNRVILIRLMEKINQNPDIAKELGIAVVIAAPEANPKRKVVNACYSSD